MLRGLVRSALDDLEVVEPLAYRRLLQERAPLRVCQYGTGPAPVGTSG